MLDHLACEDREAYGDRIAVRAPSGLRERVHRAARARGITAAELIRSAVADHLECSGCSTTNRCGPGAAVLSAAAPGEISAGAMRGTARHG